MDTNDKSEEPKKETISERLKRLKGEEEMKGNLDANGNLHIKLTINDSALIVRGDGTIEMVSSELENNEDGFIGDIEDLSNTFSLVLALASALENEELYNRIFHNLHMSLMSKWNVLDNDVKEEIVQRRRNAQINRSEKERQEKKQRVDDFKKRMNKYKEQFLDDLDAEKEKLRKDMRDEAEFHKKYGADFTEFPEPQEDEEHFAAPEDMFERMESRPRKKIKKKKISSLPRSGVEWNPYDETLKSHGFDYRADEAPPEEDE